MENPTKFLSQIYHIPTRKDMVFIADSQFTVSTTPVNMGNFFYRELHEPSCA